MSFYVYILRCRDKSLYTGQTSDPEGRLYQHKNGILKGYTHGRRPVQLVWCQEFGTRIEAMDAEWRIKKWSRAKKEALIAGDWSQVEELAALRSTTRASNQETSSRLALTTLAENSAPRPTRASGRVRVTGSTQVAEHGARESTTVRTRESSARSG